MIKHNADPKEFYCQVKDIIDQYTEIGLLNEEIIDELEDLILDIRGSYNDPFAILNNIDEELFNDEYSYEN
ncbi:hypothetical protein M0Q50_06605 [bacterium]|jgi:hypothetical protein|nr:hypothetical protein [bacterium]